MALEGDPVVVDLAQLTQRDDLKAARVRQDRPIPGHELVQPAERGDPFVAGPQVEVVGVRQDDRGADSPNIVRIERLDGGVGADRHELGRLDDAVGSVNRPSRACVEPSAGGGTNTSNWAGERRPSLALSRGLDISRRARLGPRA